MDTNWKQTGMATMKKTGYCVWDNYGNCLDICTSNGQFFAIDIDGWIAFQINPDHDIFFGGLK